MATTKFTPGPWEAEQSHRTAKWGIYSDDITGSIVAELGGFTYAPRPADVDAANARLIAAAPLMYEALQDAAKRLRGAGMLSLDDSVLTALAKAVKP